MARTRTSKDITIVALTEIAGMPRVPKAVRDRATQALNEASDKARIRQLKQELKELKRRRHG